MKAFGCESPVPPRRVQTEMIGNPAVAVGASRMSRNNAGIALGVSGDYHLHQRNTSRFSSSS